MAWEPQLTTAEQVVVSTNVEARDGVQFGLLLSDRQVCYLKKKRGLVLSDAWETVSVPRHEVRDVVLTRKASWALRALGAALIAAPLIWVLAFMLGQVAEFNFRALFAVVLGGACFTGSSNRWLLEFSDGSTRHTILQPLSSHKETVARMAAALQTVGRAFNGERAVSD